MATEKMLSVEEVLELVPGDQDNATWVNPGMTAVVRSIKRTNTKKGGVMNICTLGSQTGSAEISMSVFAAVKFNEGDLIEISGQGLRRTEYNGLQQVSLGKNTEIHVLGKSVHHEEQVERKATMAPSVNGTPQPVYGATVGLALKEGLALAGMAGGGITRELLNDKLFWADVKLYASNIIRIGRALEAGKLSPNPWAPPAPPSEEPAPAPVGRSDPPKPATRPQPGPGGTVKHDDDDGDMPF